MKAPHITELRAISQNTGFQSFPTSGTTMEYINKKPSLGLGAIIARNSKERGAAREWVSWEFTRWNVNRTDGWAGGSLVKSCRTPASRPRLCGNGICALGREFFCSRCALTVYQSHIWGFPGCFSSLTLWTIASYAAGLVDDVQEMVKHTVFKALPHLAMLRETAGGLQSNNTEAFGACCRIGNDGWELVLIKGMIKNVIVELQNS